MSKSPDSAPTLACGVCDDHWTGLAGLGVGARLARFLGLPEKLAASVRLQRRRRGGSDVQRLPALIYSACADGGTSTRSPLWGPMTSCAKRVGCEPGPTAGGSAHPCSGCTRRRWRGCGSACGWCRWGQSLEQRNPQHAECRDRAGSRRPHRSTRQGEGRQGSVGSETARHAGTTKAGTWEISASPWRVAAGVVAGRQVAAAEAARRAEARPGRSRWGAGPGPSGSREAAARAGRRGGVRGPSGYGERELGQRKSSARRCGPPARRQRRRSRITP